VGVRVGVGVKIRVGVGIEVWEASGVDVLVGGNTVMVAEGAEGWFVAGARPPNRQAARVIRIKSIAR
jgi:hypothetical protein